MLVLFSISGFIIFYAMFGYPLTLSFLDKVLRPKQNTKDYKFEPTVSLMIVAHNEEVVIKKKLENAISLNYPKNKLDIVIASDNCTDNTDSIVEDFIKDHKDFKIRLIKTKEHRGKTNAQNEAQKTVTNEILVMTDANSMLKLDSIREIVSSFSDDNIAYVCGKLVYTNIDNLTCDSESSYWNLDLKMRDIESKFQTITAGNGALYACRNKDYVIIEPIFCHDSMMPYLYALKGKRAVFNSEAVAYEKSGATDNDEFERKVRMNRDILTWLKLSFKSFNYKRYKWFSLFFFGHRFCRYSLWLAHLVAFISSIFAYFKNKKWGKVFSLLQIIFCLISAMALKFNIKNKLIKMMGYYSMTVFAQLIAVKNILTGQSKSIWEKVESTR